MLGTPNRSIRHIFEFFCLLLLVEIAEKICEPISEGRKIKRCSRSLNTTRLWIIYLVGVAMETASSFFASSLGKAPAFFQVPLPDRAFASGPKTRKTTAGSQRKHSSGVSCTEQRGANNRAENSSRYLTCFKKNSGCTSRLPSLQPTTDAETGLLSHYDAITYLSTISAQDQPPPQSLSEPWEGRDFERSCGIL